MRQSKLKDKINSYTLKASCGIAISLLAIILLLNHGYISKFLFWCISLVFGSVFTYIIGVLLFIYGLSFIVKKKIVLHNIKFIIIGISIAAIGILIGITNSITSVGGTSLTFNNFSDIFVNSLNLSEFPNVNIENSIGVIGCFLVAALNSALTSLGTSIFSICLIVIGVIFALFRPFYFLIKSINSDKSEKSLNQKVIESFDKDESSERSLIRDGVNNEYYDKDKEELKSSDFVTKPINIIKEEAVPIKQEPVIETTNPSINTNKVLNNNFINTSLEKVKISFDDNDDFAPIKESTNKSYSEAFSNRAAYPTFTEKIKEENNEIPNNQLNDIEVNNEIQDEEIEKAIHDIPNEAIEVKKVNNTLLDTHPINKPVNRPINKNLNKTNSASFKEVPIDLLDDRDSEEDKKRNIEVCEERKEQINQILSDLNIKAHIVSYTIGPSVTRFDLETERNVSINGIEKYMNDISVRLGGVDVRFVPIVLGKSTSGIEIANANRAIVNFKDVFNNLPKPKPGELYVPFGKNISGNFIQADLFDFPHMLVCGTTGSGKSIFMHSLILSMIMRYSPNDIRLVMIDPKRVEFSKYREMPHLLCPIISEPTEASATLTRLVDEMESRFTSFEIAGVSNIKQYNKYAEEVGVEKIPYIILIIDEFADLIESVKTIDKPVQRLGQKARAAGIHMIIATQRPSTDVITGSIKANLPCRVALTTSSVTDSMVILGEGGAEKLLGNGDMLVLCSNISKTEKPRVQGCFVDNNEIRRVVEHLKSKYELEYNDTFVDLLTKSKANNDFGVIHPNNDEDEAYETIKTYIMESKEYCSISMIQREFKFGYTRSMKIFNQLLEEGIIEKAATSNNAKGAKVLIHINGFKGSNEQSSNPGSYSQSTFESK